MTAAPIADRERVAIRAALGETRQAWARAWDRLPPERAELRAVALATMIVSRRTASATGSSERSGLAK